MAGYWSFAPACPHSVSVVAARKPVTLHVPLFDLFASRQTRFDFLTEFWVTHTTLSLCVKEFTLLSCSQVLFESKSL